MVFKTTTLRSGILLFVCNQNAMSLACFCDFFLFFKVVMVVPSTFFFSYFFFYYAPLGVWKEPTSPNSSELSRSLLSGQAKCLNITLNTTPALRLATLPFEHNPSGIQTSPTWQCMIPVVWNKALTHHNKGKIWQEKINGSRSLWLLPIGFPIAMTSDRESWRSWDHSYIILSKKILPFQTSENSILF